MKNFGFFLFLLFNHSFLHAQKLSILGIKLGYVKSQLLGDGYNGFSGEGFHGGLFSQLRLFKRSNLQMELLYSIKGCSSSGGTKAKNLATIYKSNYFDLLNYIEIPILFQYRYKFLFFEAGPGVGYLLREFAYEQQPATINYFDVPAKKTDLSINVGIGYQSIRRFGGGIRYTNSIIPIRRQPTAQYNFNILFILFYRIWTYHDVKKNI